MAPKLREAADMEREAMVSLLRATASALERMVGVAVEKRSVALSARAAASTRGVSRLVQRRARVRFRNQIKLTVHEP